ncbi:MAG: hypothetical protein HQL91_01130 [Magnetococcales bacterium]|nr:hypothetical protein [Magnetococcales bacterium]
MNNARIEWRLLTRAMVLLLVALVSGIGMILVGWHYLDDANLVLDKLRRSIVALQNNLLQQEEQGRVLAMIQPRYDALRQQGVIGPEPRLQWVESIREAEAALKLPVPIKYKLDPARAYTPGYPVPPSQDYQLFASRMEMTIGMLHEGDLLALIAFLAQKKAGLIQFTQCRMQPQSDAKPAGKAGSRFKVNVQATCQVEWFNFRETESKSR